ncbi:MAG: S41 family peptidase, partial [Elusimicrobia bacterium]|nr:S41 family peptidase [Elusimicrobiota bacterium]
MKKLLKASLIILFISTVSSFVLSPIHSKENIADVESKMRLFSDIFVLVTENYVEEVDLDALMKGAYHGMLAELDAYSTFLEPEASELLKSDAEGEFGGLGIRITSEDKLITVVTPLPDTPAFRMGILPGDKIVKIEDESAVGLSLNEAVQKLRGPKGTEVTIGISREGEDDLIEFTITRDIIVPQKVFSDMLEGKIGYLRMVEFSDDAPSALEKELTNLKEEGAEGIILDLRNNPGGLLNSAVSTANFFLPKGSLIVYTEGRRLDQNRKYYGRKETWDPEIPLVILVNRGSASSSEIVAEALKDHKKGIILGETTFG